jgi:hypothetical protein
MEKEIPKLKAIAVALTERPGLQLEITGRFDPQTDSAALSRSTILRKIRQIKRRDLQEQGHSAGPGQIEISEGEYPGMLERLFNEEGLSGPRNVFGIARRLSTSEMEEMLIEHHLPTTDEFMALGFQRAERVKSWLLENGKLSDRRIFVMASRQAQSGEEGEVATRVDFSLQ